MVIDWTAYKVQRMCFPTERKRLRWSAALTELGAALRLRASERLASCGVQTRAGCRSVPKTKEKRCSNSGFPPLPAREVTFRCANYSHARPQAAEFVARWEQIRPLPRLSTPPCTRFGNWGGGGRLGCTFWLPERFVSAVYKERWAGSMNSRRSS